jgi:opacity protein-like surface antigen
MIRRLVPLALAAAVGIAVPAFAQTRARYAVGVGATWTAPYDAGGAQATETSNPSAATSPLVLFDADGRAREGAGALLRFTARVSRRVSVEAEGTFSRPVLAVSLARDFESAADTTADVRQTQYGVAGSILLDVGTGVRRLRPFVAAGAGYLRQVQDGNVDVDGGVEWHAGGGVRYPLTRRLWLRADARVLSTTNAPAFTVKRRYLPQLAGAVVFGL